MCHVAALLLATNRSCRLLANRRHINSCGCAQAEIRWSKVALDPTFEGGTRACRAKINGATNAGKMALAFTPLTGQGIPGHALGNSCEHTDVIGRFTARPHKRGLCRKSGHAPPVETTPAPAWANSTEGGPGHKNVHAWSNSRRGLRGKSFAASP